MPYEIPIDYQVLIDNKCSGSEYAVYLYIKHRLISAGEEVGLGLKKIKHGYEPDYYREQGLRGISRDEIRDDTRYTLKQVNNAIDKLKELELVIPDAGDNGRYYYQVHFRLPFIEDTPVDQVETLSLFPDLKL